MTTAPPEYIAGRLIFMLNNETKLGLAQRDDFYMNFWRAVLDHEVMDELLILCDFYSRCAKARSQP